jgi:hypothetical protein
MVVMILLVGSRNLFLYIYIYEISKITFKLTLATEKKLKKKCFSVPFFVKYYSF